MKSEKIKLSEYFPLCLMFQKMTHELREWVELEGPELRNTLVFLDVLERNLDNCDAISGQVSLET